MSLFDMATCKSCGQDHAGLLIRPFEHTLQCKVCKFKWNYVTGESSTEPSKKQSDILRENREK